MTTSPSGKQFEIASGEQRATIVEVGGGIREYAVGERQVLESYPIDAMCDGAHGALLIPWPNRLADGRYRFEAVDHQVALTEPDRHNAIHGLLRWQSWQASDHQVDRVTVAARIHPQTGYPFMLDLRVTYALGDHGLTVTTTATNLGDRACPYGFGQHPYLSPGDGSIDECTLQFDAATHILTDDERQLPIGSEPVEGTVFDFREPRPLSDQVFDDAFTDLARDAAGRSWVRLAAPDGRCAELWVDDHHTVVQIYTGDTLGPARRRGGMAAEPMTCPPNAFATGDGVIRLAPGQSVTTTWGVRLGPGANEGESEPTE